MSSVLVFFSLSPLRFQTWLTVRISSLQLAIGRGNDIVCYAIKVAAERVVGKYVEDLFANMGETFDFRE